MNHELNNHNIIPAYLSTVLFENNLINNKSINHNNNHNNIVRKVIENNTIENNTIEKNTIENNSNKKKRLNFYENNIHYYYNYNLIKQLLEKFVSFSDFNELSYKHLNQEKKETYKNEMIQYQNKIIIKTLVDIFNNRKIEYENEKLEKEKARKKTEAARKKAEAEAEAARKKEAEAEAARKKEAEAEAEQEDMKTHFIKYIKALLENETFNPTLSFNNENEKITSSDINII